MQAPSHSATPLPMQPFHRGLVVSVILHLLGIAAATVAVRGCDRGISGEAGGEVFQTIGIQRLPTTGMSGTSAAGDTNDAQQPNESPNTPSTTTSPPVPEQLPTLPGFPGEGSLTTEITASESPVLPPLLGSGLPPAIESSGGNPPAAEAGGGSAGSEAAAGGPALKPGETQFMDIADGGESFVYLIDSSSSMGQGGRLRLAGDQLKASLRHLLPSQKFQVIFYAEAPYKIRIGRLPRRAWYFANQVNVDLAARSIDTVQAGQSTEHRMALEDALSLKGDVLYFLTDGEQPPLYPDDLAQLRALNSGRTRIHVIEFGAGPRQSQGSTWLTRLARDSGGRYRYVNVGMQ